MNILGIEQRVKRPVVNFNALIPFWFACKDLHFLYLSELPKAFSIALRVIFKAHSRLAKILQKRL